MLLQSLNEYKRLIQLSSQLDRDNLDCYKVGNYCDILDENNNWCVGEIIDRENDKLTILFEGSSSIHYKALLLRDNKFDHLRKHTNGYSDIKISAFIEFSFRIDEIYDFKIFSKEILKSFKILFSKIYPKVNLFIDSFSNLNLFSSAFNITQNLRGKTFYKINYFMTNPFIDHRIIKCVSNVVEIIYNYLEIIVYYLKIYKENIKYTQILVEHPKLFLVDKMCSMIASLHEILITLKRIFGRDNRINYFFKVNNYTYLNLYNSFYIY